MSFCFKRKESAGTGVIRMGSECIDHALKCSSRVDLEGIHSIRKEIKKVRALLRMVRRGCRKNSKALKSLRSIAKGLAPIRDAHVLSLTVDQLSAPRKKEPFPKLRRTFRAEGQAEISKFRKRHGATKVRHQLRRERKRIEKLRLKSKGWNVIGPGLKRAYQGARDARVAAAEQPTPENFHEWRKRVKDLWYLLQLLKPACPKEFTGLANDLGNLGDMLGDEHDLAMLRQAALNKSAESVFAPEIQRLLPLIESRRVKLRAAAFRASIQQFEEKPARFCRRLQRKWKLWKGPKPKIRAAQTK